MPRKRSPTQEKLPAPNPGITDSVPSGGAAGLPLPARTTTDPALSEGQQTLETPMMISDDHSHPVSTTDENPNNGPNLVTTAITNFLDEPISIVTTVLPDKPMIETPYNERKPAATFHRPRLVSPPPLLRPKHCSQLRLVFVTIPPIVTRWNLSSPSFSMYPGLPNLICVHRDRHLRTSGMSTTNQTTASQILSTISSSIN